MPLLHSKPLLKAKRLEKVFLKRLERLLQSMLACCQTIQDGMARATSLAMLRGVHVSWLAMQTAQ